MSALFIVGAGQMGRVIADLCRALGHPVAGFIDDAKPLGEIVDGIAVMGRTTRLEDPSGVAGYRFALAIGNNHARHRLGTTIRLNGGQLPPLIHPASVVSPSVTVGSGATINAFATVLTGASIGDDVLIDPQVLVGNDTIVGDGVYLAPACRITSRVTLRQHCFIGVAAAVLPGLTVGAGAILGAGSVLIGDLPDNRLAIGNPARAIADANLDDHSSYPASPRPTAPRS
ncbi:MAG: NeuD/PglB/VioB family sugar acetyltransferase [Magnetococcales bacterium]|nr:NeuD/PglB/VioB family sugar acetyltransferase [Magnetococcales bacterium]